jgi:hypothetical protein
MRAVPKVGSLLKHTLKAYKLYDSYNKANGFSKITRLACRFQQFCKKSPIKVIVTVDDI